MAEKYPRAEQEIYLNYRGKAGKGFHLGGRQFQFLPIGYFFTGKHIEALFNLQIDELPDSFVPEKMDREELSGFKKKLAATLKAMKIQERVNRERMDLLRDLIDETDYVLDDLPE